MSLYFCVAVCSVPGLSQDNEFIDSMIKCNEYNVFSILFKVSTVDMNKYLRNISVPISIAVNGYKKSISRFFPNFIKIDDSKGYTLFLVKVQLEIYGSIVILNNLVFYYNDGGILNFRNGITAVHLVVDSEPLVYNIGRLVFFKHEVELDKKYLGYLTVSLNTIRCSSESKRHIILTERDIIYAYCKYNAKNPVIIILYDEDYNFYDITFKTLQFIEKCF